ncbi:hypothetical protein AVEN_107842-1 [Araneus ventricosus]|uniref:Uncharacterized protein n=1 Tax=Araneus ventricosus TaxID=182803 RepID=A0A4Y2KVY7_ARAVE|nr:hypothetical protein AVEN_107842-1 [Araneus ventricosus]
MEFGRREEDSTARTRRPETREEENETRLNSEPYSDLNLDSHIESTFIKILICPRTSLEFNMCPIGSSENVKVLNDICVMRPRWLRRRGSSAPGSKPVSPDDPPCLWLVASHVAGSSSRWCGAEVWQG